MYGSRSTSWLACSASRRKISRLVPPTASVERAPKLFGMSHRLRFKQLGPCPAARARAPSASPRRGSKWRATALRVRRADATRVRGEPLVAQRAQVLRVRVEHVLAPDLARGVEEREAHPDRDLEEASAARGRPPRGAPGRRRRARAASAGSSRRRADRRATLQPLDLERRDVDQARGRPARPLERGEQVVDRGELGSRARTPAALSSPTSASR